MCKSANQAKDQYYQNQPHTRRRCLIPRVRAERNSFGVGQIPCSVAAGRNGGMSLELALKQVRRRFESRSLNPSSPTVFRGWAAGDKWAMDLPKAGQVHNQLRLVFLTLALLDK